MFADSESVRHWKLLGIQLLPAVVDLSLFPALQTLEIPLIAELSGALECAVLATLSNSPITLELLTNDCHLRRKSGRARSTYADIVF